MSFEEEIKELEYLEFDKDYITRKGSIPILFTAPHTMKQVREDGSIKLNEPYTKAMALYFNKNFHVSCLIKINDTGLDSNLDNRDEFKIELLRFIKENHIRLVIDLHGSDKERDYDIELGTLNNLSSDFSTVKELEEAFTENGIPNVVYNDPFKGGAITESVFGLEDVDVIQVEINGKYRSIQNIEALERLCISFERFIKQYNDYLNR